jgi:hypothetical protein
MARQRLLEQRLLRSCSVSFLRRQTAGIMPMASRSDGLGPLMLEPVFKGLGIWDSEPDEEAWAGECLRYSRHEMLRIRKHSPWISAFDRMIQFCLQRATLFFDDHRAPLTNSTQSPIFITSYSPPPALVLLLSRRRPDSNGTDSRPLCTID